MIAAIKSCVCWRNISAQEKKISNIALRMRSEGGEESSLPLCRLEGMKWSAGSFGLCDPASKEMHHYLERLEEQQKLVLELITGKKQALIEHMQSKDHLQIKQVRLQGNV